MKLATQKCLELNQEIIVEIRIFWVAGAHLVNGPNRKKLADVILKRVQVITVMNDQPWHFSNSN